MDYGLRDANVAGSMFKGISSKELVVKMGKAGFLGFLGTGGLELRELEQSLRWIQHELRHGESYGANLLCQPFQPASESEVVELLLRHRVPVIEAAGFVAATPALVRYRAKGLTRREDGRIHSNHKIIAKVSRPESARAFLQPPPQAILDRLIQCDAITPGEASMAMRVPLADDLCVEADSGGHTDMRSAWPLLPAIAEERTYSLRGIQKARKVRVGIAGGIGTPQAVASAFVLGGEFVLTGSINQCTVEARMSDTVKDLLQQVDVHDTGYVPAGDAPFELGTKSQVMKKGVSFPARANRLYDLWQRHDAIDDLDAATKAEIEEDYFGKSFDEV